MEQAVKNTLQLDQKSSAVAHYRVYVKFMLVDLMSGSACQSIEYVETINLVCSRGRFVGPVKSRHELSVVLDVRRTCVSPGILIQKMSTHLH